ncbi:MAG: ATP-binding protein [Bacteroidales bacterium]
MGICDEFGYISYDKEGAELLFNYLSLRAGSKSTIITTNLSLDRWPEIFGDPTLTAAMVSVPTHTLDLFNQKGACVHQRKRYFYINKLFCFHPVFIIEGIFRKKKHSKKINLYLFTRGLRTGIRCAYNFV